jgi:hypothetical protein
MSAQQQEINGWTKLRAAFSLPTPWPVGRAQLLWFLLVVAIGITIQLAPRPAGWPLGYLFAEDGQVFLTEVLRDGT